MELMKFIPTGRENALPAKELARLAGYKDVRTMQQDIHRLRKAGHVILSATDQPNGYFLPDSSSDISRFVRSMNSRVREIKVAVRAAEQYLDGGHG